MFGKKVIFGSEARDKLMDGVSLLERAVGATLGPRGRNVLIDKGTAHPIITKDGVTVARELVFKDKYRNLGAKIIKESAIKTNIQAGDGTTTATVLAANMAREGIRCVAMGFDPNEVKAGMDFAKSEVLGHLDTMAIKISGTEDIYNVAMISANNDPVVGQHIEKAFSGIGEHGIVTLANSYDDRTHVKFSSGMELDKGYISSVFANSDGNVCDMERPNVLICNKEFSSLEDAYAIIAMSKGVPLAIFAPDFAEQVSTLFIEAAASGKIRIVLAKLPGFTRQSTEDSAADLAIILNAKVLYRDGMTADKFNGKTDFGTCERLKITPIKTTIIGADSDELNLEAYCTSLSAKLIDSNDADEPLSQNQKDAIKARLARLTGGVATICVGAATEIELIELKHRIEDAVNAVRAAIEDGIVAGGGTALTHIQKKLEASAADNAKATGMAFAAGFNIVKDQLTAPIRRIIANAGGSADVIINLIQSESTPTVGYNALTGQMGDLVQSGVIDPVKVTKCAIINAISVASMLLTTECVITNEADNVHLEPTDPVMQEHSGSPEEMDW